MSNVKVSEKVGNNIWACWQRKGLVIENPQWNAISTSEKGQSKYLAAWKAGPRMLRRDLFSHLLKELLKMLEKERGRRGGWRKNWTHEWCDKTQRDHQHWITQSSPGITYVYNQAVTVRVFTPIMATVGKRIPLLPVRTPMSFSFCLVDILIVYCKTLPQSNTLSFPVNFVSSFTQLIREVFEDLDFKPLN